MPVAKNSDGYDEEGADQIGDGDGDGNADRGGMGMGMGTGTGIGIGIGMVAVIGMVETNLETKDG